ncbi:MAG: hypothetical protein JO023_27380 [Chloroflexi bacterium]|nr:hypothetical protein [Chloroflexota bacterium]
MAVLLSLMGSIAVAQENSLQANLVAENDSGIAGSVSVTDMGDSVRVDVRANGANSTLPMHIHEGQCQEEMAGMDAEEPAPEYALSPLVNGASTTTLNVPLANITSSPHTVEVHRSDEDIAFHLACADLVMGSNATGMGGMSATAMPGDLPNGGDADGNLGLTLGLSLAGVTLIVTGAAFRRRRVLK